MTHSGDIVSHNLSQPLRVDTDNNNISADRSNFYEDKCTYNDKSNDETDSLGPLPPKWEKAYTENGEVYFIDHSTGTSHWLDPRLSKFQKKSLEDCSDDELPYGWEKISDPHYGTYFIDHVNRKTQYENPVIQAKKAASEASARASRSSFTKDPSELCGERLRISLVKSSRGLGFTIVGGDDGAEEFLQIKSVVPKGPAWLDGQLRTGDVIVFVNETCVLGYTHNQIVRLFQSINVGSTVQLEICRGYPLPFDPNDPNTEVVTTIAVDSNIQPIMDEKSIMDSNFNFLEEDNPEDENILDGTSEINDVLKGMNNINVNNFEVRVGIIKGNLGFGFTIADSACGQRVKKILDRQRCKNLMEGDILLEINNISLVEMSHDEVVQVLKNCPCNSEALICVQRDCSTKFPSRSKSKTLENRLGKKDIKTLRSKTPTTDIYSTQPREVLPSRPKTPLIDTRGFSKPQHDDLNLTNKLDYNNLPDANLLRISMMDNHEDLEMNAEKRVWDNAKDFPQSLSDHAYGMYMSVPHHYSCICVACTSQKSNLELNPGPYDASMQKKLNNFDYWPPRCPEYQMMAVTLSRHDTGFGFRIVGGIEDKSQVAVGYIVPGGAADLDGRIRTGDEIASVDGISVIKASHKQVVQLVNAAATRGHVNLVLHRRLYPMPPPSLNACSANIPWSHENSPLPVPHVPAMNLPTYGNTFDVTVNRKENEGFGFVIISSVNKVGSTIGRLIDDSPAERCGKLRVGDFIVAVNHIDIMHMNHGDIVNLIKESGLSVTLTIAINQEL